MCRVFRVRPMVCLNIHSQTGVRQKRMFLFLFFLCLISPFEVERLIRSGQTVEALDESRRHIYHAFGLLNAKDENAKRLTHTNIPGKSYREGGKTPRDEETNLNQRSCEEAIEDCQNDFINFIPLLPFWFCRKHESSRN